MTIVSLTSYPIRFRTVNFLRVLNSLVTQKNAGEFKVCLTLFADDLTQLTKQLIDFIKEHDIELLVSNVNHKVYLKFLLAAEKYGETSDIVTVDDDIAYDSNMLSCFLEAKEKHPGCVVGGRVHQILYDGFTPKPYKSWVRDCTDFIDEERNDLMTTGVGGVLYPKGFFDADGMALARSVMIDCPDKDDFALTRMAMERGFNRVLVANPVKRYRTNSGFFGTAVDTSGKSQFNSQALCKRNVGRNENDQCLDVLQSRTLNGHLAAVYITDKTYAKMTGNALRSFLKHNPESRAFVVLSGDSSNELNGIKKEIAVDSDNVTYIDCSEYKSIIDEIKRNSRIPHVSSSAILKMYLPEVLPDYVDRVLYMDGDTVVLGRLDELLEVNLDGKLAGVISDEKVSSKGYLTREALANLNYEQILKKLGGYFNSGVMLLNLVEMRKRGTCAELIDFSKNHKTRFVDQDTFNLVFAGDVQWLPIEYDLMPYSLKTKPEKLKTCKIFHAAGPDKDFSPVMSSMQDNEPKVEAFSFSDTGSEQHDAVFVLGPGSKYKDAELRLAIRSMRRYCKFVNRIIVVGSRPRCELDGLGVTYISCEDPYRTNKDSNMMYKVLRAIRKVPDLSEDFLLCSDDQVVTKPCSWNDFKPKYTREITSDDPIFENATEDRGKWINRLFLTVKEIEKEGRTALLYEPHIWSPVNKYSFKEMTDSLEGLRYAGVIKSQYYNSIDGLDNEKLHDHVFVKDVNFGEVFKKPPTFISYNDGAFNSAEFRDKLSKLFG